MNFFKKNVLIFGYGRSGKSAENLLKNICEKIIIYDKNFTAKILNNKNKLKNKLKNNKKIIKNNKKIIKNNKNSNNFNYYYENQIVYENNFENIIQCKLHFCIVSPGVDLDCEEIKLLKKMQVKILSELELGVLFCKGKIFAITGTNGKTTTVNLLYEIFKTPRKQSFLCGNVGVPICDIALKTTSKSLIVCEVSSFQMEATNKFLPFASAILNLAPDHLDRHKTFENYVSAKNKINKNFKTKKYFNADDDNTYKLSNNYCNSNLFSLKNNYFNKKNNKLLYLIKKNNLIGEYNLSNILCAVTLAKTVNIPDSKIKQAVENFVGLPHRLQLAGKVKNITFINDSKSTNILSTVSALDVIKDKIILLLGGSDKDLDFAPIFEKPIYACVAYGETKDKILKVSKGNIFIENNFENACKKAVKIAEKNKDDNITILFSPACASFDEFVNYEQRGEKFCEFAKDYINSHTS